LAAKLRECLCALLYLQKIKAMPVISMFYGIIVSMYYLDTKQHHLPHIHVSYANFEAIYQIPDGEVLEGNLPTNKHKLILAWIEIHRENLMADWNLAVKGNPVFRIDPLK
jgi:hypothetical protein